MRKPPLIKTLFFFYNKKICNLHPRKSEDIDILNFMANDIYFQLD